MITSRDHHKASRMINRALMAGLLSVGVDVQDLGVAPVSVVRYQISALGLAGGVHVRKSPDDPQLIDIKFFDARGLECAPDREKSVERLFFMEDFYRAPMEETGVLTFPHAGTDRYRDGLLKSVDAEVIKRAGLRMVLDYGFGSASAIFPGVLGALGVEVISLNAYLDESRITKTTDEFQRSLTQLSNIVRTLGADLGVLLDTGAEKVFLVDEKGDILPGDLALALIALLVMRTQPAGRIVVPVTASRTLDRLAEEHGFQITRSRGTPRALTEAALADDVVLVGEELGGVIFPRFQPAFDGMAAVVHILEMMARLDVRLHQLTRAVPESHIVRLEVPCPNERKGTVMRRLMEPRRARTWSLSRAYASGAPRSGWRRRRTPTAPASTWWQRRRTRNGPVRSRRSSATRSRAGAGTWHDHHADSPPAEGAARRGAGRARARAQPGEGGAPHPRGRGQRGRPPGGQGGNPSSPRSRIETAVRSADT